MVFCPVLKPYSGACYKLSNTGLPYKIPNFGAKCVLTPFRGAFKILIGLDVFADVLNSVDDSKTVIHLRDMLLSVHLEK